MLEKICAAVCRPFCQNPVKDLQADTGCNFDKFFVFNVLFWLCLREAKLEKNEMGVKPADPEVVTWPKAKRKCQCRLAQAVFGRKVGQILLVAESTSTKELRARLSVLQRQATSQRKERFTMFYHSDEHSHVDYHSDLSNIIPGKKQFVDGTEREREREREKRERLLRSVCELIYVCFIPLGYCQ